MTASFLLLHGYSNRRGADHWQYWLARRLEAAGARVLYPQLPDPDNPTPEGWLETLWGNLAELAMSAPSRDGSERAERIVICHSLSCLLWFHAATQLPAEQRPDRLVLVSPPACEQITGFAPEFCPNPLDRDAIRASARREIRIVCSDANPYNPRGVPTVYGAPLGLPCDVIAGAGHISSDDGYGPWPAILSWCERPGGVIGGPGAAG